MVPKISTITFDIETAPRVLDPEVNALLQHKLRDIPEEKKGEKVSLLMHLHPLYADVTTIGLIHEKCTGEVIEKCFFSRMDEREVVYSFLHYISTFSGTYVHFNGLGFDVPFLLAKCALYEIEPPARFAQLARFRTDPHYDLMQVLTSWGQLPWGLSLDEACHLFNIRSSKTVLGGYNTAAFLAFASDEDIQRYCMGDVRAAHELFHKVYRIYQ